MQTSNMKEIILDLTKFDVAERQLNQAISLFFNDGDPVSIHTLSEAAAQVLHDISGSFGGTSIIRDTTYIREGKRKEWLASAFKSRNFFKHADRDRGTIHRFNGVFNHFSILDAVNMYTAAKKSWTPESYIYFIWFWLYHPHLIREDDETFVSARSWQSGHDSIDPTDLSLFGEILIAIRTGQTRIACLSLEPGLPDQT